MLNNKRIAVVLPAYNAGNTLRKTYNEIPRDIVDDLVLVDDCSSDDTVSVAAELGIEVIVHQRNMGYGANQKTCYKWALQKGADIIVMLHPDYQYSPRLVAAIVAMIAYGEYDAVLGSRILCQSAIAGGMPSYKYVVNRLLTLFQNVVLRQKLSEFHTGYRAFSRKILEQLPLEENSNDFSFDNEMIVQIIWFKYRIGEISCPTRYTAESSSIGLMRGVRYAWGVVCVSLKFLAQKHLGVKQPIFSDQGRKLAL